VVVASIPFTVDDSRFPAKNRRFEVLDATSVAAEICFNSPVTASRTRTVFVLVAVPIELRVNLEAVVVPKLELLAVIDVREMLGFNEIVDSVAVFTTAILFPAMFNVDPAPPTRSDAQPNCLVVELYITLSPAALQDVKPAPDIPAVKVVVASVAELVTVISAVVVAIVNMFVVVPFAPVAPVKPISPCVPVAPVGPVKARLAAETFSIAPVIGLIINIGEVVTPVGMFDGNRLRLFIVAFVIVVVARVASPVEVNVPVAVMFVPVALVKKRVVMYAKAVSISESPVILSAVVVPVSLIAFRADIFTEVVAPLTFDDRVLDALAPVVYEIKLVVLDAVAEAREAFAVAESEIGPFMVVVPFNLISFNDEIFVLEATPFTVDLIVLDAPPVYTKSLVVLDARSDAEDVFSIAPVMGLVTSMSDVDEPVFRGESFRLFIVAFVTVALFVAFKLVKAKLVPVALVKKRSVIEARMDLKKPVTSRLVAVVVPVSLSEFNSVIVVVANLPFTVDDIRLTPVEVE
jgi:hypothetical protein